LTSDCRLPISDIALDFSVSRNELADVVSEGTDFILDLPDMTRNDIDAPKTDSDLTAKPSGQPVGTSDSIKKRSDTVKRLVR